jgi:hypothetical protein
MAMHRNGHVDDNNGKSYTPRVPSDPSLTQILVCLLKGRKRLIVLFLFFLFVLSAPSPH